MLRQYATGGRWPVVFRDMRLPDVLRDVRLPGVLRDMRRAQDEMDRLFGGFRLALRTEFPAVNVWVGTDGAIVVGTTDGFTASKAAPAPFDPAYAYDAGSWNILRQTVQTLMRAPRGGAGDPVPEAAESCKFTDTWLRSAGNPSLSFSPIPLRYRPR